MEPREWRWMQALPAPCDSSSTPGTATRGSLRVFMEILAPFLPIPPQKFLVEAWCL